MNRRDFLRAAAGVALAPAAVVAAVRKPEPEVSYQELRRRASLMLLDEFERHWNDAHWAVPTYKGIPIAFMPSLGG